MSALIFHNENELNNKVNLPKKIINQLIIQVSVMSHLRMMMTIQCCNAINLIKDGDIANK